MNARIMQRLEESFTPVLAHRDPNALHLLRDRIGNAGRQGTTITYSDLAAEIPFNVYPDRRDYTIDVHAWKDSDRALIRDLLGALSLASYRAHCFLLSALVVYKESGVPSDTFLGWIAHAYETDALAATVIWGQHRDRAIAFFQNDGASTSPCPVCPE